MLAVVAMASCSKSELTTRPEVAGDVEIKAGSTALSIDTKAPYVGTISSTNPLTAYVMITDDLTDGSYKKDAATPANNHLLGDGYMKFVEQAGSNLVGFYSAATCATSEEAPKYYPANGSDIAMAALVPYTWDDATTNDKEEGWKFSDADCKNVSYLIDGKTDVMASVVTKMKDQISGADAAINKTTAKTTHPEFDFKHLLTLIRVKVYTGTVAEQTSFGKITKIELVSTVGADVNNRINVQLKDGAASVSGAASGVKTPFYYCAKETAGFSYADKLISDENAKTADGTNNYGPVEIQVSTTGKTGAAYVAYAIVAPFTAVNADGNLKLKVYTENNNTTGIDATINKLYSAYTDESTNTPFTQYTAGKLFDVTLHFIGTEIKASAKVTAWDETSIVDGPEVEIK